MALLQVGFFSNSLGKCVNMDVILPQNTNGQIGMEGHSDNTFPTLYLLHGMSDDHSIWLRRTSIERYASAKGIAVVMPSSDLAWYTDMECGFQKYYTYVAQELPRVCRSFFKGMSEKREDNWLAGLSMGGYGALKIGLNESESFGKVATLSGAFSVEALPDMPYWNAIFGEGNKRNKHSIGNAVERLVAENRVKPEIYMCCGAEDDLLESNHNTRDILRGNNFDVIYKESSGNHTWEYWDTEIQPIIDWMTK